MILSSFILRDREINSIDLLKTTLVVSLYNEVIKLEANKSQEKIPHVGWNEINITKDNDLLNSELNRSDFYFVHSYHFVPKKDTYTISTTPYCGQFVSAIQKDNVYGTQFHPEKSQQAGFRVLTNFLNL